VTPPVAVAARDASYHMTRSSEAALDLEILLMGVLDGDDLADAQALLCTVRASSYMASALESAATTYEEVL
jgi:hypothetical protein